MLLWQGQSKKSVGYEKHLIAVLRVCGLILGMIVAVGSPSGAQEGVVAKVGESSIAGKSLREELARRGPKADKAAVLDEMIRFETLHAAATRAGLDRDPEILAALRHLMVDKYRRQQLDPLLEKITADDNEAEAYYKSHRDAFAIPGTTRLALIQITLPMRVSQEKRAQLRARIEQARLAALRLPKEVDSFGSVAVEYSDDQATRYRGGNTGWLTAVEVKEHWPEVVGRAVTELKQPGDISPIIESEDRFFLFRLMERKTDTYRSFAEVKDWCRHEVLQKKQADLEKEFFVQLQKSFPAEINSLELEKISSPMIEVPHPPALPAR